MRLGVCPFRRSLAILMIWCAQCACATVFTLSTDRVEGTMFESYDAPRSLPRVFSGVAADALCVAGGGEGITPLCLLDLPLSVVGDIAVLPFTAYQQVRHGNFHPRCIPEQREEIRARNRREVEAALELCREDAEKGISNCGSMIAPDGTVLVRLDGGAPCP